jgi:hypothetical protein
MRRSKVLPESRSRFSDASQQSWQRGGTSETPWFLSTSARTCLPLSCSCRWSDQREEIAPVPHRAVRSGSSGPGGDGTSQVESWAAAIPASSAPPPSGCWSSGVEANRPMPGLDSPAEAPRERAESPRNWRLQGGFLRVQASAAAWLQSEVGNQLPGSFRNRLSQGRIAQRTGHGARGTGHSARGTGPLRLQPVHACLPPPARLRVAEPGGGGVPATAPGPGRAGRCSAHSTAEPRERWPWLPPTGWTLEPLDYPAGPAWTRRIGRKRAIAGIPEAASVLCRLAVE